MATISLTDEQFSWLQEIRVTEDIEEWLGVDGEGHLYVENAKLDIRVTHFNDRSVISTTNDGGDQ